MLKPSFLHIMLLFVFMFVAIVFVFLEFRNIKKNISQTQDKLNDVIAKQNSSETENVEEELEATEGLVEEEEPIIEEINDDNDNDDEIKTEDLEEIANEVELEYEEEQNKPTETKLNDMEEEAHDNDDNEPEATEDGPKVLDDNDMRKQLESLKVAQLKNILEQYDTTLSKNKKKEDLIDEIMSYKRNGDEQQRDGLPLYNE